MPLTAEQLGDPSGKQGTSGQSGTLGVKTLDLSEAAGLLHMHPEVVRGRAKRGLIPGAKVGRRWVFIEADLAEFIRSLYSVRRRALQVTTSQEDICH